MPTLRELVESDVLFFNDGYRTKQAELGTPGFPILRVGSVGRGRIEGSPTDHVLESFRRRIGPKLAVPGDIVLTTKGTVGRVARIGAAQAGFVYSPQVCFFRVKDTTVIDPDYFYYWLCSPSFSQQIEGLKAQTDMADYINLRDLNAVRFEPISTQIQRAAGQVLSALDDKIELNRLMNETMEDVVRSIFRSWFVDFDPVRAKIEDRQPYGLSAEAGALFPDSFQESEMGQLPSGWQIQTLEEVFKLAIGGVWGQEEPTVKETVEARVLRGIDCHELAEGLDPEVPSRWVSENQLAKRNLTEGDVLIEGSGSFCGRSLLWREAYEELVGPPVLYSNFCKRLSPKQGSTQAEVAWYQLREAYARGEVQGFRTGTAFPNLDVKSLLANFRVIVPSQEIASVFASLTASYKRVDLGLQSRTLAKVRATLLPKLISGEMDMREAEHVVEAAI